MDIENIIDRKNNFRINSSKQFSTQKSSQNEIITLSSTLSKVNSSYYNKINQTNSFKQKECNFNNPKQEDVNQLYFDNLNEKVFNLYNLVDEIKMKHNNEKDSIKKSNNNPKYYINNEYKEQTINFILNNDKNIPKNLNSQISINKNTLAEMMLKNASFKKIILNKKYNKSNIINKKKQNLKKNRKVICSISPEENNNILSNYNINSFSDFKNERLDKIQNRNNNYKLISFKEREKNNINRSPIGRFDSYFFNSYSNTDKKKLNNQVLNKNNDYNINININKKLEIESPACLSYHSIIRKASPKEISIEHNIEYDINNKNNTKNLNNNNNTNKIRKHIIDRIPYNKKDNNYKFVTENNIKKNYITENNIAKKNQTLNYDTNLILNYKKFKSTTVSKLIRDYYCNTNTNINNNEDEEYNSKNSSINVFKNKTGNNSQITNIVQDKTIENKLNNNKMKVKKNIKNIKNIKKDIKMHSPTKVEKIVQNDIEITLEYNKDNKIQQLILYDKNGNKINFIPKDKINNNAKTINTIFNPNKRVIFKKNKNKNITLSNSSYSKRNSSFNDKFNIWKNNENRSSVQLNKIIPIKIKEKQIYPKFKISPPKFYSLNLGNTLIRSINASSPLDNYIQTTNKKRLPINTSHKKSSKAFSAFKDTLLKSENYYQIKNSN